MSAYELFRLVLQLLPWQVSGDGLHSLPWSIVRLLGLRLQCLDQFPSLGPVLPLRNRPLLCACQCQVCGYKPTLVWLPGIDAACDPICPERAAQRGSQLGCLVLLRFGPPTGLRCQV